MSLVLKTSRSDDSRKSSTSPSKKIVCTATRSRCAVNETGVTKLRSNSMEYLANLVKEKKHMDLFPAMFVHSERLLGDEINRIRGKIFQTEFVFLDPATLPEPTGEYSVFSEKLFVPREQYPDYNFVGRILGPRGLTAKQLEQETGCKIMVRGRGSMRDTRKEEMNRGKPNWEHLDEDLHVLIQCEDFKNRAKIRIDAALKNVKKLLTPSPEGTDELKKKQLTELAIINGTFKINQKPGAVTHVFTPSYSYAPMRPMFAQAQPCPSPLSMPMIAQSPIFPNTQDFTNIPNSIYEMLSIDQGQAQTVLPPLTPLTGYPHSFFNAGVLHNGHFFHESHFNQTNVTAMPRTS